MAGGQAFDAPRGTYFLMNPEDVLLVGSDTEENEHTLSDARARAKPNEALVASILKYGVINPIVVRKNGDAAPEVVDGRQRVICTREANRRRAAEGLDPIRIKVIKMVGSEADAFRAMVASNEARIEDEPLNRARKIARGLNMGQTIEEIAVLFAVTVATVQTWVHLLDLAVEVQDAIDAKLISPSAALKLRHLTRQEQVTALDEILEKMGERAPVLPAPSPTAAHSDAAHSDAATADAATADAATADAADPDAADDADATADATAAATDADTDTDAARKPLTVRDVGNLARRHRAPRAAQKTPRKPVLRDIVSAATVRDLGIDPMVLLTLKWVLGDVEASAIPGLEAAFGQLDEALVEAKEAAQTAAHEARARGRAEAAARRAAAQTEARTEAPISIEGEEPAPAPAGPDPLTPKKKGKKSKKNVADPVEATPAEAPDVTAAPAEALSEPPF